MMTSLTFISWEELFQAGDIIVSIDGIFTNGLDENQLKNLLTQSKGTKSRLEFQLSRVHRSDEEVFSFFSLSEHLHVQGNRL